MWETITNYIIWATVVILIAYDVWVIVKHGSQASISVRMVRMSKRYLIIPFALGMLAGHLFFPLYSDCM